MLKTICPLTFKHQTISLIPDKIVFWPFCMRFSAHITQLCVLKTNIAQITQNTAQNGNPYTECTLVSVPLFGKQSYGTNWLFTNKFIFIYHFLYSRPPKYTLSYRYCYVLFCWANKDMNEPLQLFHVPSMPTEHEHV